MRLDAITLLFKLKKPVMYTMTVGYLCNLLPFNRIVFVFPGVITDNTNGTMGLHRGSNGDEPEGTQ